MPWRPSGLMAGRYPNFAVSVPVQARITRQSQERGQRGRYRESSGLRCLPRLLLSRRIPRKREGGVEVAARVLAWSALRYPSVDWRPALLCAGAAVAVVGVSRPAEDFRVYWLATRSVLWGEVEQLERPPVYAEVRSDGHWNGHPLYGEASGLVYPMWYRYPPLFLFVFAPFAALPFSTGFWVWTAANGLVLGALLLALASHLRTRSSIPRWMPFAAAAGVMVYQVFKFGNAHFLTFALTAAALLAVERRPAAASTALGLGIALKAWPIAFLPHLALLGHLRTATTGLLVALALTVAPAAYFGWLDWVQIMRAWWGQESTIVADSAPLISPSHSLLGVLTRHLTEIDLAIWPDANYPNVNWLDLQPGHMWALWLALVGAGGLGMLFLIRRTPPERLLELHGVAFCAIALFQPYATKVHLVILIWPALVAFAEVAGRPPTARALRWGSLLLPTFLALNLGREWVRYGDAVGIYVLPSIFLGAALTVSILRSDGTGGARVSSMLARVSGAHSLAKPCLAAYKVAVLRSRTRNLDRGRCPAVGLLRRKGKQP